jgi:hypothetical protein
MFLNSQVVKVSEIIEVLKIKHPATVAYVPPKVSRKANRDVMYLHADMTHKNEGNIQLTVLGTS